VAETKFGEPELVVFQGYLYELGSTSEKIKSKDQSLPKDSTPTSSPPCPPSTCIEMVDRIFCNGSLLHVVGIDTLPIPTEKSHNPRVENDFVGSHDWMVEFYVLAAGKNIFQVRFTPRPFLETKGVQAVATETLAGFFFGATAMQRCVRMSGISETVFL